MFAVVLALQTVSIQLKKMFSCTPVFLSPDLKEKYYKGTGGSWTGYGMCVLTQQAQTLSRSCMQCRHQPSLARIWACTASFPVLTVNCAVAAWLPVRRVNWRLGTCVVHGAHCADACDCTCCDCTQASANSSYGRCSIMCCPCHHRLLGALMRSCGRRM